MDIGSLDLNELAAKGVTVELTHPGDGTLLMDGEGKDAKPVTIVCYGRDSDQWKSAAKRAKAAQARTKAKKQDSMGELDDLILQTLSECTVSWSGIELDGKKLECNQKNAHELYSRFGWIAEQVLQKVTDRANYFLA